ncbi:MAG TPA: DNA methyltransferase, partial [Verrucomicrobiae bacterium]|nr:DNA methyltransferase [Verrucomicrobiae bacterium]
FDGEVVIQFPKPVQLIQKFLQINGDRDDLVFDFFAGSATTAQALYELNRQDGGERRFVLVQLPEPTEQKGFGTIAEIGKERIRRVIQRLKEQTQDDLPSKDRNLCEDLGFAVFKLTSSNFKPWVNEPDATPENLAKAMELFNDPLADGWKLENVIYEVAVKEGFSLALRVENISAVKANKIFQVTDAEKGQSFRICLDEALQPATVKELALAKNDLFICRDVAMDDKTAANLALQCRLKTI